MHADPIRPGPKTAQHWIPLFLAHLALDPDVDAACAMGYTTREKVEAMRAYSGYFDAAYRIILRQHRRRASEAGLPVPAVPAQPDFSKAAEASEDLHALGLLAPANIGVRRRSSPG